MKNERQATFEQLQGQYENAMDLWEELENITFADEYDEYDDNAYECYDE